MSRPIRIEYENAVYHVMNRGRGRSTIFHGNTFTSLFLDCLGEASQQFGLEVLAYCLMDNHYHLLVRTPRANLGRCMRHVNGVYAQSYNKLQETDGPLFRGRYKAIVVDVDNYLLQVSRYIHRNPIETQKPLVTKLTNYIDSSYLAYINRVEAPSWLNREVVLSALNINTREKYSAYQAFVEDEKTGTLNNFYAKKSQATILGEKNFAAKIKEYAILESKEMPRRCLYEQPSMKGIVSKVAHYFNLSTKEILQSERVFRKKNMPRKIAMHLCKQHTGATLMQIAEYFNVGHYSTVSQAIRRLKDEMRNEQIILKAVDVLSQDHIITHKYVHHKRHQKRLWP